MAVANFEELCAGFCEVAGLRAPVIEPDGRGLLAFHMDYRGVTVDVMHWPARCADRAFLLFDFGPAPTEARQLHALLKSNFLPFQQSPGVYGCSPTTGDVTLQCSLSLFDASAHSLLELVEEGVAEAARWKERHTLPARIEPTAALEKA